ncbi:A-kinase anchoring protein 8 [Phyllostomus discolor]|uniref:A-kinase anchoring protein 8 n=1 Tax=Phyllostomus discolor TaxID=89673 RepID=A0A834DQF2_9CHIR|nr:A-kinase anchoring protein 8 [Phyllostomus discolor]
MEQGYGGGYGAWNAGPTNTQGAYGTGVASWQVPSASSHSIPTTPGLVCPNTIPTAPAIATTMTLTWGLTTMVALVVSTATAGTPPVSGAHLTASYGTEARVASRTGATPALLCAVTLSCHQLPLIPCLLPGLS